MTKINALHEYGDRHGMNTAVVTLKNIVNMEYWSLKFLVGKLALSTD